MTISQKKLAAKGSDGPKWKNLGSCPNQGGGSTNPKFLSNFSKTKFALELPINVMKHIIHVHLKASLSTLSKSSSDEFIKIISHFRFSSSQIIIPSAKQLVFTPTALVVCPYWFPCKILKVKCYAFHKECVEHQHQNVKSVENRLFVSSA